jgi:hypothetical protein
MLAKLDFITKLWQQNKFLRLKIMCLWLSFKKMGKKIFFCILKVTEKVGFVVGSGSAPKVTDPQH